MLLRMCSSAAPVAARILRVTVPAPGPVPALGSSAAVTDLSDLRAAASARLLHHSTLLAARPAPVGVLSALPCQLQPAFLAVQSALSGVYSIPSIPSGPALIQLSARLAPARPIPCAAPPASRPELLTCGCMSGSPRLCPLSSLSAVPVPFAVQSVAGMAKQRRALRGRAHIFAPSFAGGVRHHKPCTVAPEQVPWPQREFHPCHSRRIAIAARSALFGPSLVHTVNEPLVPPSLLDAARQVAADHPFISHVQLATAIAAAQFARPRARHRVPERGAASAAHSRLNSAAFAAEAPFHGNAAYLAEVAEFGCDTGFCAGSRLRFRDNHPSAYEHSGIIDADVALGLKLGHVIDVTQLYHARADLGGISSPLGVVFHPRTNKPRVITDCSCGTGSSTNDSCDPSNLPHTRLHVPSDLADTIVSMQAKRPDDPILLQNYDLSRAYKSVAVRAEDWWTMAFSWRGRVFWWIVSPFGHRTSSNALCAATDILTGRLARVHGVSSHPYVDDLGTAMFTSSVNSSDAAVKATVALFGFDIEAKKLADAGAPSNAKDWIGFQFNARARTISIPAAKLQQICASIIAVLSAATAVPRFCHSLWSQLLFVSRAVPALAPFTVALRQWVQLSGGTRAITPSPLSTAAREDLGFWLSAIADHNGVCMLPSTAIRPTANIRCDSCSTGYGGLVVETARFLYGRWCDAGEPLEGWHINFKEAATACALLLDAVRSGHKRVHIYCDNTAAVAAINRMRSISPDLLPVVRALAHLSLSGVVFSASYINTLQNTMADAISRHSLELLFLLCPQAVPISLQPSWASQLRQYPRLFLTQSTLPPTPPATMLSGDLLWHTA